MIRFIVAALWILGVTIGTIFFAYSATGNLGSGEDGPKKKLEFLKTEVMSVPLIHGGDVQGYFLTRLVYTVEPGKLKLLTLPADTLFVDEVYSYIYSNPKLDFAKYETLDLDALRTGIRDSINERVGDDVIHDVLVEQIDYLSKREIRDNVVKRRGGNGGDKRPVFGKTSE